MSSYILYWGIFFISSITAYKIQRNNKYNFEKYNTCKVLSIVLFPLILSILRYNIGIDYQNYILMFLKYNYGNLNQYFNLNMIFNEPLNYILVKIGYVFTGDYIGVFAIYAILTYIFFGKAILKFKDKINLPIAFLVLYAVYYSATYNIVRQMLAVSILAYAYRFVIDRKMFKFILAVFFAGLIHNTAFIFLMVYAYNPNNKNTSKVVRTVYIVGLILFPFILKYAIDLIYDLGIFTKYFENYNEVDMNIWTSYLLRLPIYIPLLMFRNRIMKYNEDCKFYFMLILLDFSLLSVGFIYQWGFRFSYYTYIAQVILISSLINTFRKNEKLYISAYFILWYMVQFYLFYVIWGRDGIVPYFSIFQTF